jgi:NAD dependent epimerase/dehydratase family enzyme
MANDMLIRGQRVVPKRALDAGFQFSYPTVDAALTSRL